MARPLKMVHTCMRVRDINASLRFYEALGFERRGKLDFGSAYNIYLGLPGDGDTLELTVNAGQGEPYDLGNGYGHVAVTVDDLDGSSAGWRSRGTSPSASPTTRAGARSTRSRRSLGRH